MPSDSLVTAESPSSRKAKINKRSTNSYSSEEWKRHRALITRLYFEEGRTLKDVREVLEREHNFTPSERMYKSRLHSWGLDKKKKEHEMLDLVRQGLELEGEDKDKVFTIRGRSVTLADALHYFNRKGIKDPTTLLDQAHLGHVEDSSTANDGDLKTGAVVPVTLSGPEPEALQPAGAGTGAGATSGSGSGSGNRRAGPEYDNISNNNSNNNTTTTTTTTNSGARLTSRPLPTLAIITQLPIQAQIQSSPGIEAFAAQRLSALQTALGIQELKPMPAFRTLPVESIVPVVRTTNAEDSRLLETIYMQLQAHYRTIFSSRNLSVNSSAWTATSDDADADKFYHLMYHGYNYLWSGQKDEAFKNFFRASELIEGLIKDNHVAFLVYILDLLIRHDGTGYEEPLLNVLQHVSDMARTVFGSESQPIYLIALWLKNTPTSVSRSWLAEGLLRKLLDFFQDSIGYFHEETIALLQTFATALLNRKKYEEAALRFQQLVDAFETTRGGQQGYEVCYALRSTSEAYFHMEKHYEALQALKAALERSQSLDLLEEREIYVRCVRGLAEISNKLGRREEAIETMQHVVECTREAFGPDHAFTNRARMHLKSVQKGIAGADSSIPPMVYRLGRGGSAAKFVWTTRASPTRLVP